MNNSESPDKNKTIKFGYKQYLSKEPDNDMASLKEWIFEASKYELAKMAFSEVIVPGKPYKVQLEQSISESEHLKPIQGYEILTTLDVTPLETGVEDNEQQ